VVHGFTGSPQSVRGLAEALAAAGFAVELPLLPGHGTSVEDLAETGWQDWSAEAERAYLALAARCERVVVAGLSMGGSITAWLATRHPEIAGIVCINAVVTVGEDVAEFARQSLASGTDRIPSIGGDVADPGQREKAYEATPLRPLLGLHEGVTALRDDLGLVTCPVLVMTSPQDHVVEPSNSDLLAAAVSGPVERVTLERSYHVATLDYDRDLIDERTVAFARKVTGPPA
jgi:carboxylesterase